MGFQNCTKAPINGDLDGEWEVMEVYPETSGGFEHTRLFYNFSRHVCMLTYYGGPFTDGNMIYDGTSLSLEFPYVITPAQYQKLNRYGIFSNPVTFTVEFHGKKNMVLYNETSRVILRKF